LLIFVPTIVNRPSGGPSTGRIVHGHVRLQTPLVLWCGKISGPGRPPWRSKRGPRSGGHRRALDVPSSRTAGTQGSARDGFAWLAPFPQDDKGPGRIFVRPGGLCRLRILGQRRATGRTTALPGQSSVVTVAESRRVHVAAGLAVGVPASQQPLDESDMSGAMVPRWNDGLNVGGRQAENEYRRW